MSEFDLVSASYNTCNQHLEQEDKEFVVKQLLEGLTPGETRAIKMLYGIGCMESSLKMIAHELRISPQRASQLCNSAIKKMKRKSKDFAYAIAN
jgi:RNA polymerase sigma factor (sigma-70 family)